MKVDVKQFGIGQLLFAPNVERLLVGINYV